MEFWVLKTVMNSPFCRATEVSVCPVLDSWWLNKNKRRFECIYLSLKWPRKVSEEKPTKPYPKFQQWYKLMYHSRSKALALERLVIPACDHCHILKFQTSAIRGRSFLLVQCAHVCVCEQPSGLFEGDIVSS